MRDLYANVQLPTTYDSFGMDILVLPLSLTDYYKLWWDDDGPLYGEKFIEGRNPQNRIIDHEKTNWRSPPDQQFTTFMGKKCQSQRDRKWRMFQNLQYPNIPVDMVTIFCNPQPTSFIIGTITKRASSPYADTYVIFNVWEARTMDKRSN
jgi:hypothetical protein